MTDRPLLMGVVNVTPDSFSDGGRYLATDAAITHGLDLLRAGADILDIGGESTRPGATRPLVEEELARVLPVVEALVEEGATVSVDTMRSEVAEVTLAAGAHIINDVSGGLADPAILAVAADFGARYVAMHWRAHSTAMQQDQFTDYGGDVVRTVLSELDARIEAALEAGIEMDDLIVDPGLGFSKTAEQNWELIDELDRFMELGYPVLIGASRKRFLGPDLAPLDREPAHLALLERLRDRGVWAFRVHDVAAALQVVSPGPTA